MTAIVFLFELFACENGLACVDDDNEFSAVDMRGELGTMFSSENVGSGDCGLAKGFIGRVDDIPFAFQSFFFCHIS